MNPSKIINNLNLKPHPEGGWYKETFLSKININNRSISSMIYYLLKKGEYSHWHRVVDADEIWIWNLGGSLELQSYSNNTIKKVRLGKDFKKGQTIQAIIPKGVWQSAKPIKNWVLVTCIVTPAFSFEGFELASKEWKP